MRYLIVFLIITTMLSSGCGADRYQARMHKAHTYLNQQQYDQAQIEILHMIEENPQAPEPYFLFGMLHYRQGKYAECLFNIEEADRRGFKPTKEYYLVKGISQYLVGDVKTAGEILASMPDAASSGTAQKYLGMIHATLGEYEMAVAAFERASGMERDARALTLQGRALFSSGETSRALEVYQNALTLAPDDDELVFRTASLMMLAGNHEDAYELFGRIAQDSPYGLQSMYNRAEAAIRIGKYPAAISLLDTYLRHRHDDSAAIVNLGSALIKTGEYVSAADLLSSLLEREYSVQAAYNLALANYKLGKYEESAFHLAGVVREYPDNAAYRYAYGLSLSSAGDIVGAAEQMSAVLVLAPSHEDARAWLETHEMLAP